MDNDDAWLILFIWFFLPEQNERLEQKAWFRFLRILQNMATVIVVLGTALLVYMLVLSRTQTGATLVCNDGTKWNAMDQTYKTTELDAYQKCGLCTLRNQENKYSNCEYGSPNMYNSYKVTNETYKQDHSFLGIVGWSALFLFGTLLVVKIIAKSIVYIFAGKQE